MIQKSSTYANKIIICDVFRPDESVCTAQ